MLQTDFGNVQIIKFKIPTDNGKWLSGNLFRPVSATAENKVPIVITSHGYLNNNQMQDISAIELSRRGIAVIAMDAYFHGDSSSSSASYQDSGVIEGMGMIPLVEFAYSQLDWVDNTKIGVMGHSMGGSNTWNTARHYGRLYMQALEDAQAPDSDGGKTITEEEQAYADSVNKVAAAFPTSSVRNTTDEVMAEIHCNFGTNFGFYDEGAYRCVNGDGDLHDAPEALAIINSILPESEKLTYTIEIAKMYGNPADDTLRVVYNPHEIHPWQHFSTESAGYTVDFFTTAFQMENPIPSSNQYWLWKELFNCIGLVGAALLIVPLATLLLKVPCFASLAGEEPKKLPALTTAKSKAFFWGSWCLSWIISWLSFIPIGKLDQYIFPEVTNRGLSNWFPQPTTNFILLWAVFNGIVGLALFWLSYKFVGSKNGVVPSEMWGIKISLKDFFKTLALAVCVFIGFYSTVMFSQYFFQTDYRIWTLDIRAFTVDKLYVALQYWPLFFIFYLANSISINSSSRVAGAERRLQPVYLCAGQLAWRYHSECHPVRHGICYRRAALAGGLVASAGHRPAYRPTVRSGIYRPLSVQTHLKVWLGAMVNTLIIVMMGVANTCTFLPL